MLQQNTTIAEDQASGRYERELLVPNEEVETNAEEMAKESDLGSIEFWKAELGSEVQKRNRNFKRGLIIFGVYVAATIPVSQLLKVWLGHDRWFDLITSPAGVISGLTISLVFMAAALASTKAKPEAHKALKALKANGDASSVSTLIYALQLADYSARNAAREALIEVLPKLTEQDNGQLSGTQITKLKSILSVPLESVFYKDLNRLFQPAKSPAVRLRVAVLQALGHVGREEELPIVRHLAEAEAKTAGEQSVQDAARTALPLMLARIERNRGPQTLLRSSTKQEDPATLLRSSLHLQSAPDELLRPSE